MIMKKNSFDNGVWPVVLTPFRADGAIDFPAYRKLLEYYIAEGVTGLFAVCLSSELYQLSPRERLDLAREAVAMSAGRVPVVSCGYLGNSPEEKLQSVYDMAALGVDAVVIPACQLVPANADDEEFFSAFETLLSQTAQIRLGIYECPEPYHRLIPPQVLGRMAHLSGGRLAFLKDTCCDAGKIAEKLRACAGTELKIYNANLATCLESLRLGCAGYSGTSANFYPGLLAELCRCFREDPERAEELQEFFDLIQRHVEFKYPRSAKRFLNRLGIPMRDFCRVACDPLTPEQLRQQKALQNHINRFKRQKNIEENRMGEKERSSSSQFKCQTGEQK